MIEKSNPLRVLVVEDDEPLRKMLREILVNDAGYDVSTCESGEDAIQTLKEQTFDVVMLDHKMPGISGLNVLQWMHEQKMETPVLMLTAAGSEFVAVEAMKLGAYDYLRKEYVDIEHLPIIINGIHERYLFKREKEHRDRIEGERRKDLQSIGEFRDMVTSITQIVNKTLMKMSLTIDRHGHELTELRQHQSVIAFGLHSILDLANSLYKRLSTEEETHLGEKIEHKEEKEIPKNTNG